MSQRGMIEAQIALSRKKSQIIGLLLTFFLGPLGLLYVSLPATLMLSFVWVVVFVITFGYGVLLVNLLAMVWSVVAISAHNRDCEEVARDQV